LETVLNSQFPAWSEYKFKIIKIKETFPVEGLNTYIPNGEEDFQVIAENTLVFDSNGKLIFAVVFDHPAFGDGSKCLKSKVIETLDKFQEVHPCVGQKKSSSKTTTGQMFGCFWKKRYETNASPYVAKKEVRNTEKLSSFYEEVLSYSTGLIASGD